MRKTLAGVLTGFMLMLGLVAGTGGVAQAAPPSWHGSYVQITKITPTYVNARIRCGNDPNPDGTQWISIGITNPDGTLASYRLDVVQYCDMKRHQVTVPLYSGTVVVGTFVDVYGSISGDGGEINFWYEDWKVQR
jgi:hypothetical protein